MKKYLLVLLLTCIAGFVKAESGTLFVNGDVDKFYPVIFFDGNWENNKPTILNIGRSDVHTDAAWQGSLISTITYHTNNYGHRANFINVTQAFSGSQFIAGWADATGLNGTKRIIVWLKGHSTYYFSSDVLVAPTVYDGVQNALPFHEEGGADHTYKTTIESYANVYGVALGNDLNVAGKLYTAGPITTNGYIYATSDIITSANSDAGGVLSIQNPQKTGAGVASAWKIYNMTGGYGNGLQFWAYDNTGCATGGLCESKFTIADNGNVGVGTTNPTDKLAVNGNIRSKKVIVTQTGWPDYVFDSSYQLPSLDSVSSFIQVNKHLPDMPSAATVEKDGHDLGEVQKLLLKKMEEMTLYMIEQNKKIASQDKEIAELKQLLKNENKKK